MKVVGIAIIMLLLMVGVPSLAQGVDKGNGTERNALSDRISLHRQLTMQFSGNYQSANWLNRPDLHRYRLDFADLESDRIASDALGVIMQDALHLRTLQHRCVSESIPATACY